MNPKNDSNKDIIDMLQEQIFKRDEVIIALKRENEVHSIVNKTLKRKYRVIMLLMSVLLIIESGISVYNLIF